MGYAKEKALQALKDLAQDYFKVLLEYNDSLPEDIDSYTVPLGSEKVSGSPAVIAGI
jgi:predicted RNase H-like HicB family nuclease